VPGPRGLRSWLLETLGKLTTGIIRADTNTKRAREDLPFTLHGLGAEIALMFDPYVRCDEESAWGNRLEEIVMDDAMEALVHSYSAQHREALFRELLPVMDGDVTSDQAAESTGKSPEAIRKIVSRMKQDLAGLIQNRTAVAFGKPENES
jgi:hypothetical protein